jgi:hypothetical protein
VSDGRLSFMKGSVNSRTAEVRKRRSVLRISTSFNIASLKATEKVVVDGRLGFTKGTAPKWSRGPGYQLGTRTHRITC